MADEERTEATAGEVAGESTEQQAPGAGAAETTAGGEDPRDEQIRLMREENERLRAETQRERSTTEGRAESTPTTPAPSYEQALAQEAQAIAADEYRLMEKEAIEGQTVESIRSAQKLIERKQRLGAAVTAHALKKTEMNTFVASLPKEERDSFKEYAAKNAHRFADLEALYDGFDAKRLRAERGRTTKTAERAEAVIKRNEEGRVSTATREVTAAEARPKRDKMTGKQFDDEFARLIAVGDHDGALALSNRVNSGKLDVED